MTAHKIVGVGVLLQTLDGSFLFQQRDYNTRRNPGRIAPFGGGLAHIDEAPVSCAIRELNEELELNTSKNDFIEIGIFESDFTPENYICMFILKNINPKFLRLHEGREIKELSFKEAVSNPLVTDFTKKVLIYTKERYFLSDENV